MIQSSPGSGKGIGLVLRQNRINNKFDTGEFTWIYDVVPVIPNETDFVTAAIAETIIVGSSLEDYGVNN
jgi:hypothetical protein